MHACMHSIRSRPVHVPAADKSTSDRLLVLVLLLLPPSSSAFLPSFLYRQSIQQEYLWTIVCLSVCLHALWSLCTHCFLRVGTGTADVIFQSTLYLIVCYLFLSFSTTLVQKHDRIHLQCESRPPPKNELHVHFLTTNSRLDSARLNRFSFSQHISFFLSFFLFQRLLVLLFRTCANTCWSIAMWVCRHLGP